jgi:hypothetical protein
MKSKIVLLFLAALAVLVVYLSYPVIKNRYFGSSAREIIKNDPVKKSEENITSDSQSISDNDSENPQETKNTVAPQIDVAPKDCDNNCSSFKKDNEKEYCQEICGTKTYFEDASDSGGTSGDCASEKGIQKDYCLKDIAVGNKDFKACDEIADANIKKSCKSRITEDIIEAQNGTEQ